MFRPDNWFPSSGEVYSFLRDLCGANNSPWNGSFGDFNHPVYGFAFGDGFDPLPHLAAIQERLDSLGWQLMGIGWTAETAKGEFRCIVSAPRLLPDPSVGDVLYHVTERWRWNQRIQFEGLRPGSNETSHTQRWDGVGKCFVSVHTHSDATGDGATHWLRLFAETYRRQQSDYVILAVDVRGLAARYYRDPHSAWGVIVDRFGVIDPPRLRVLDDAEVEEAFRRSVWRMPSADGQERGPQ